jgi:hypothetical protein
MSRSNTALRTICAALAGGCTLYKAATSADPDAPM